MATLQITIGSRPSREMPMMTQMWGITPSLIESLTRIHQIRRRLGVAPKSARLRIVARQAQYVVVCEFDESNLEAAMYAYHCNYLPAFWDHQDLRELAIAQE